jgi:hypothetical protein
MYIYIYVCIFIYIYIICIYVYKYQYIYIYIGKGVQVNTIANSGGTAIMFAAGGGHNETTRLLLEHKADVNIIVHATPEYIINVAKSIADGKELRMFNTQI